MARTVSIAAAFLLLTACDTPAQKADRAYDSAIDAQHQITALQLQVADMRARIVTLEKADEIDSKNITTLFKSRDAMLKLRDLDEDYLETSLQILRNNDKHLNANSPQPLPVAEDE